MTSKSNNEFAWTYLAHGALGVDLFFVISGFIMYLTTQNCDGSLRYAARFTAKRFARIWPLFFVVSLIYLAMTWWQGGNFPSTYFTNVLSQLVFRPVSPQPSEFFGLPVDVAWTLCFEAFFYAVIAVSLLSKKRRWWITAALLLPGLIVYPLLNQQELNFSFYHQAAITQSHYANLLISPMVWEFILGLIAGRLYTSEHLPAPPRPVAILMLLIAAGLFVTIPETHIPTLYGPSIECGGLTIFTIFLLIALASKTISLSVNGSLIWLGGISYSLYLTHKLGFMVAAPITAWLDIQNTNTRDWASVAIHVLCGLATGTLFHYAVEAPLSEKVRKGLMHMIGNKQTHKPPNTEAKPI